MMQGRRRTDGRGQALAEFAIVAPIFLLLVFFLIQLGLVMASQNGLVDGVRTAARRAATYRINDESFNATVIGSICQTIDTDLKTRLQGRVVGYSSSALSRSIVYEWQQSPGSSAYFLVAHITASYQNPLYVPIVSAILDRADGVADDRLTLTASEQMRVENPSLVAPASTAPHDCAGYLP